MFNSSGIILKRTFIAISRKRCSAYIVRREDGIAKNENQFSWAACIQRCQYFNHVVKVGYIVRFTYSCFVQVGRSVTRFFISLNYASFLIFLQNKGKGKGKGKGRAAKDVEDRGRTTEDDGEMKTEIVKLKALDVFAGCGGKCSMNIVDLSRPANIVI